MKKLMCICCVAIAGTLSAYATGRTGSNASAAVTLTPSGSLQSRSVALVGEYDSTFGTTSDDWGVYYFKVTLKKGTSYTFWTSSPGVGLFAQAKDADYERDEYEPSAMPFVTTDRDGVTTRCIIYGSDWESQDPASWVYYIILEGDINTSATLYYSTGEVEEQIPLGDSENPYKIAFSSGMRDLSFVQFPSGLSYFQAKMISGRKYVVETTSGTTAFPASLLFGEFGGTAKNVSTNAFNARYEIYPSSSGDVGFRVASDSNRPTSIRYFMATARPIGQHSSIPVSIGGSYTFTPGKVNADGSDWYDDVVDGQLFAFDVGENVCCGLSQTAIQIGDIICAETFGSVTNLTMILYDSDGNILLRRTSGADGSRDVRMAFTLPVNGRYYLGVCERLANEREEQTSGNSVTLSFGKDFADHSGAASVIPFRAVRFNAMDGVHSETVRIVAEGQVIGALPELSPSSAAWFVGWFTAAEGGEKIETNHVISGDITFYAHWRAVRRVVFSENCGLDAWSGGMEEIVCDPGDEIEIPECGFTREGRSFTGWSTNPNGTVEYHAGDRVVMNENLLLYAIWDGPPQFVVDEWGNLVHMELNGASEVHIPDSVKFIDGSVLNDLPESLFDTNSIPGLVLFDGWMFAVTEEGWNEYVSGSENAPSWNLDLTGVRGVVDGFFYPELRVSSLVVSQPALDYGVAAMFGPSVSSVTIAEGVTNIYGHSLSGLIGLTNLTIASSVEWIGASAFGVNDAFAGCPEALFDSNSIPGLKMVDGWVVGLSAGYADIYSLQPGAVDAGLLDLTGARGVAAFALGGALPHVVHIPATMPVVGIDSFTGVPLTGYSVAADNPSYSSASGLLLSKDGRELVMVPNMMQLVKIPDGVERIGASAFFQDSHGAIVFPRSVNFMSADAFGMTWTDMMIFEGDAPSSDDGAEQFVGLSHCRIVYVPDGASGWRPIAGTRMFEPWMGLPVECKEPMFNMDVSGNLASVNVKGTLDLRIPSGITGIVGNFTGDCMPYLESVKIPSSVTWMTVDAFNACPESLFDTNSVPGLKILDGWVVGLSADYRRKYETGAENAPYWNLELSGVRGIADCAFTGASRLKSVAIPDSVRHIGAGAFDGCANLCRVEIGDGVETIGPCAFDRCSEDLYDTATAPGVRLVGNWAVGWTDSLVPGSTLIIPDCVRGIADGAFAGCGLFARVVIGEGVEHVGADAFGACHEGIYDMQTIPGARIVSGWLVECCAVAGPEMRISGVRGVADSAFDCLFARPTAGLRRVSIGAGCVRIGTSAFRGCMDLCSVEIGGDVESIGENAFALCNESLYDRATVPGVKLVDGWATGFEGTLRGDLDLVGVRGIADYAFAACEELSEVRMGDGIARIPRGAFCGCRELKRTVIPDSVTSVGIFAFDGCSAELYDVDSAPGVKIVSGWAVGADKASVSGDVSLPELRGVAENTFAGCDGMTGIVIPNSVVAIGCGAFTGCGGLTNMVLPFVGTRRGNSDTRDSLFGCIFGTTPYPGAVAVRQWAATALCCGISADAAAYGLLFYIPENLKRVTITDETLLPYGAFYGCAGIEAVVLNEGLREISGSAFLGCEGLSDVSIPESVDWIGDSAFYGCTALKTFTFGENIAYLGYSAFGECPNLDSVYFLGDAPYAECDVFSGSSKRMVIYVKSGTTGWASGSSGVLPTRWPEGNYYEAGDGRRIKIAAEDVPSGNDSSEQGAGGAVPGGGTAIADRLTLTVTNVIVHYVTQSISSDAVFPSTTAGIVNIISEVNAGTAVAVTKEWAEQYPEFSAKFGEDLAKAITSYTGKTDGTGKPMMVWQDFVAGTDPTNPEDKFTASITFEKDSGRPVISWTPELPPAEAAKRSYKTYGKVRLTDSDWTPVDGDTSAYNFFKVTVEMQ